MSLQIEYLDINTLKPYEKNARKHGVDDVDTIKASIREFGMNDPIGIWGADNIIVEGHGRVMACKELGLDKVPCIRLDSLTDEQRRAYTLAHNKTAEMSSWDFDILDEELDNIVNIDMEEFGFDFPDLMDELPNNREYGSERERSFEAYNLSQVDLSRVSDKWEMPTLKRCNHIPTDLISFNYAKTSDEFDKGIHFYIDDYQFERVWNDPHTYLDILSKFDCVLTPDFSLYTEMPLPMQLWNIYRSRMIGQMMQDWGMQVIPTLQWCKENTFEAAFEGIEKGGTVSVSTIGVKREESASKLWFDGMTEAMRVLEPKTVIVYGGDIGFDYGSAEAIYIANHNSERFRNGQ